MLIFRNKYLYFATAELCYSCVPCSQWKLCVYLKLNLKAENILHYSRLQLCPMQARHQKKQTENRILFCFTYSFTLLFSTVYCQLPLKKVALFIRGKEQENEGRYNLSNQAQFFIFFPVYKTVHGNPSKTDPAIKISFTTVTKIQVTLLSKLLKTSPKNLTMAA